MSARLNLLLEGTQSALEQAIVALTPQLRQPISTWVEGIPLLLPVEAAGTLMLREVGRLTGDEQQRLALWLDENGGRVQVISTTSEPIFDLVQSRAFLDFLYYRLNVIRVEVSSE